VPALCRFCVDGIEARLDSELEALQLASLADEGS
jgi:hypothetical protein